MDARVARWATVDDVAELVRLRELMYEAMGVGGDRTWQPSVTRQLREGLVDGRYFAAVVDADAAPGRLAGCGIGMVWERLAGPGSAGTLGYIQSMATDPAFRRQGIARRVLTLLLDGFAARGVTSVGLHATTEGEPLYRAAGFAEPRYPELRRHEH